MTIDAEQLLEAEFLKPPIKIKQLRFVKVEDKRIEFVASSEESEFPLYLFHAVSRQDKDEWQAFQDLLRHAVQTAQSQINGIFGIDVLSAELPRPETFFEPANMAQLLVNHAKKMKPAEKILIRYSQVFLIFHYRAPADWGKIEVKTHVDIYNDDKDPPEKYVNRLWKKYGPSGAILVLHDLSRNPLFKSIEMPSADRFCLGRCPS